ncbi:MAG: carboxymuconolactone decarboxylase family protein [Ardenticatenaceae bacterium]|nr:carboxymuconolactone decarboxylase family protein [Ardenticatenaceae bacterium]MCB9444346.1 carboxymuconolactone decarboxylase family protein [Ardenticatenaceae bacterium]
MPTKKFNKRIYQNPAHFWRDFRYPFQNRDKIKLAMDGKFVSPAFRERLMLAVTAVNGCRYCSYFHTKEALKTGLPESEIRAMLKGEVANAPTEELPALLYAQHWAENNAVPDPDVRQKLIATYGSDRADAIDIVLRMIRLGNLLGNTTDYWLFRFSFGRFGI